MLRERAFDAGAVTLNYAVDDAEGPPLVLLHGVTSRWQGWLPVMPALALRWRLYALDLRGHGRSGRAGGNYRLLDYAGDVVAFLRRQIGAPAALVGHSLGAMISIAVAAQAPDLVRAVVLEDPPLAPFSRVSIKERPDLDAAAQRARALSTSLLDPEVLDAVLEDRAREGYDLDALLRRIACPVLLLQGNPAIGGALADEDAGYAAGLLARGTRIYLPDAGHGIHAVGAGGQPDSFIRLVHDFLESL